MLSYRHPLTTMKLRDGLRELRAADGAIMATPQSEFDDVLTAHDAVHVVFGLDITETDEVLAHVWMLRGTTLTHAEMRDVMRDREHQSLSRDLGHFARLRMVTHAVPAIVDVLWRSRKLRKRWPWRDFALYLDVPLDQIRREFGIVLRQPVDGRRVRGPHHRGAPEAV